jgi:septal ring-binding cell division protein DamX
MRIPSTPEQIAASLADAVTGGNTMVSDYQATLLARLAELDQHLRELLIALQGESDPGAPIDSLRVGEAPNRACSTEIVTVWEATVRRFTDSLDVRLDVLQDELDGLTDELRSLQQAMRESAHAAQRRAVRVYAAGQSLLGLLVIVLIIAFGHDWGERSQPITPEASVTGAPALRPLGLKDDGQPGPISTPDWSLRTARATFSVPSGLPKPQAPLPDTLAKEAVPKPSKPLGQRSSEVAAEVKSQSERSEAPTGAPNAEQNHNRSIAVSLVPVAPLRMTQSQNAVAVTAAGRQTEPRHGPSPEPNSQSAGAGAAKRPRAEAPQRQQEGLPAKPSAATARKPTQSLAAESGVKVLRTQRFAIQLISFHSQSSVEPFAKQFGIVDRARYLVSGSGKQKHYGVVLLDYATKNEAESAVKGLSPRLGELRPWVRALPSGTRLVPVGVWSDTTSDQ